MPTSRLKDLFGRAAPPVTERGEVDPLAPWGPPRDGVREIRHYRVRPHRTRGERPRRDVLSGGLLWAAGMIIAASLAGAAYVAYESQRLFALAHNHGDGLRAAIVGALPDAGWISMAIVALVAALRGRSSLRARVGVVVFFALSLGAQLMYAPGNAGGYLVAVVAPVTLAWMLETFVVEVRRWALKRRGVEPATDTPILAALARGVWRFARGCGRLVLWLVRMLLDRSGTWAGLREWVLDEAPLAPGRTRAGLRAAAALEQASAAERHVAELEAEVARVRAEERERAEELLAGLLRKVETGAAAARRPGPDEEGPRRWANKAEGFRALYAELRAADDPRLTAPDYPVARLAADIAGMVLGEDGEPMSASQGRAVLYDIYAKQGRPAGSRDKAARELSVDGAMIRGGAA